MALTEEPRMARLVTAGVDGNVAGSVDGDVAGSEDDDAPGSVGGEGACPDPAWCVAGGAAGEATWRRCVAHPARPAATGMTTASALTRGSTTPRANRSAGMPVSYPAIGQAVAAAAERGNTESLDAGFTRQLMY